MPARRPRLMHWPTNPRLMGAGCLSAIRLSTVSAACAADPSADWQPIRNGRSDGAAESPAATMRTSSTLVNVSSVSKRPKASVLSPLRRGQVRYAEPSRPNGHLAWQRAAATELHDIAGTAVTFASAPSSMVTPSLASRLEPSVDPGDAGTGPVLRRRPGSRCGPAPPARRRSRCRWSRLRPPSQEPRLVRRRSPAGAAGRFKAGDRISELGRAGHTQVGAPLPTA